MTISRHAILIAARRLVSCLIGAGTLFVVHAASAAELPDRPDAKDRLQVAVDAGDTQSQRIALGDRIDRDLMAFRFRLEAMDAAGNAIPLPAAVSLSLRVGSMARWNHLVLGAVGRDVTIPRPWALRLRAEDSLVIVVQSGGDASEQISLLVSIDYEPVERDRSRLAVTIAPADRRGADVLWDALWEWTQPGDGRLIAITGLPLDRLGEISLIEVESGRVVWSRDLGAEIVAPRSPAESSALRFGVSVEAGRAYRLVARRASAEAAGPATEPVVAMVLPSRAP